MSRRQNLQETLLSHPGAAALWRIRKFVTLDDSKNIAAAVVGSRLDYCNSLLYGVSEANLNKLQRVQNSLARAVLFADTRSSATQNLAELHWLPVRARIKYKVALLTFKTLTTHRPTYLHDLLQFRSLHGTCAPANTVYSTSPQPGPCSLEPSFLSRRPNCLQLVTARIDGRF